MNHNESKFHRSVWGYIPQNAQNANGNFNLELNVINGKGYFLINNNYVATLEFDDLKKGTKPSTNSSKQCFWKHGSIQKIRIKSDC